ncbi:MAG: hypothetical protein JW821_11365 [Deltaproteobacteria bacterium]|nr:hypothetical protein [Deltaproteobacteria bacterium]
MDSIKDVLLQRLERKGVQSDLVPGLIKNVAHAIEYVSSTDAEEINERLHLLGWDDFHLDDHTMQLIIAGLEADGFRGPEKEGPLPCENRRDTGEYAG